MKTQHANIAAPADNARALVLDLLRPLFADQSVFDGEIVQPNDIPHPEDAMLVHHDHMTVRLERHFGSPVSVQVMRESREGDFYTRQILLFSDETPVEFGVVRLNFRHLPGAARDEILAKRSPLGAILIRHEVHRRVKPQFFLRFPAYSRLMAMFDTQGNPSPLFGRIATIYCENEPAIELLEVVCNTAKATHLDTVKS